MVVPYVAGGAADITARIIAQKMSASMGAPVVVENKPGANGIIGTDLVAKAKPDGYTQLLDASGPLVVNPSLYKSGPYDPLADPSPISQATRYQYALVLPRAPAIHSADEPAAMARAQHGELASGPADMRDGGHPAGQAAG